MAVKNCHSFHAHGVVKLKNVPGIADLVVKTNAGKLMAENLEKRIMWLVGRRKNW